MDVVYTFYMSKIFYGSLHLFKCNEEGDYFIFHCPLMKKHYYKI